MSEEENTPVATAGTAEKVIQPRRIYIKDTSFEAPNSPAMFTKKWEPKLGIEISNSISTLEEDVYEVIIVITATVSVGEETAFLAEVHQAGIFTLKGHDPDSLKHLQHVYCLNTLYPYACAALADLVNRGGFPPLLLAPVNFGRAYNQQLQEKSGQSPDQSPDQS
jgi:preprotein translocase subunit SecB